MIIMEYTLDQLHKEATEMTVGISELDEKFGIKRTDYKPVFNYSVETVLNMIVAKEKLKREFNL